MTVAALYVDVERGPYSAMPGVDAWGSARDARRYMGHDTIVAHPPCGPWGALSWAAHLQDPTLAPLAFHQLMRWGGVLEHPANSRLWGFLGLPEPGAPNDGLWTLQVDQCCWGHQARKRTWLLIRGSATTPGVPPWQEPTHVVSANSIVRQSRAADVQLPEMLKRERHLTPPAFAAWLVDLAGRCHV